MFTAALYSGTPTLLACKSSALLLEYSHIFIWLSGQRSVRIVGLKRHVITHHGVCLLLSESVIHWIEVTRPPQTSNRLKHPQLPKLTWVDFRARTSDRDLKARTLECISELETAAEYCGGEFRALPPSASTKCTFASISFSSFYLAHKVFSGSL